MHRTYSFFLEMQMRDIDENIFWKSKKSCLKINSEKTTVPLVKQNLSTLSLASMTITNIATNLYLLCTVRNTQLALID